MSWSDSKSSSDNSNDNPTGGPLAKSKDRSSSSNRYLTKRNILRYGGGGLVLLSVAAGAGWGMKAADQSGESIGSTSSTISYDMAYQAMEKGPEAADISWQVVQNLLL